MSAVPSSFSRQATCVAVAGRGVLIEGASGSGKTSLALELIDRGGRLVGDDGVLLTATDGRVVARPHPNTRGLVEVRNLGILPIEPVEAAIVALVIVLDPKAPRFIDAPETIAIGNVALPLVRLWPQAGPLALKAELALTHYGLVLD